MNNDTDLEKKGKEKDDSCNNSYNTRSSSSSTNENNKVIFFTPSDPSNPYHFSTKRKWTIALSASIVTFFSSLSAGSYTFAIEGMISSFQTTQIIALTGITFFTIFFGISPMLLSPLSEIYGRNPVYFISFLLFTISFLPMIWAPNIATMLVFRGLSGASASPGSTMVGGTMSDLFISDERGLPMAIFTFMAFFGTALGPLFAGFVEQYIDSWRWIFGIQAIACAIFLVIMILTFRETRGTVLLSRKAARLRKETGDHSYKAKGEENRASFFSMVKYGLARSFGFLFTELVVISFTLWLSFGWGILYLFFAGLPIIGREVHNFTPSQNGLYFLPAAIGPFIALLLNPLQDRWYRRSAKKTANGKPRPESRLYMSCIATVILSLSLYLFAWTTYPSVHWIWSCIAIAGVTFGLFSIYLAVFNYTADAYTLYASSALSGISMMRNFFGAGFPLFTEAMYRKLGYQWAMTLLAIIATVLSAVPFILIAYGPQIRARSKYLRASID